MNLSNIERAHMNKPRLMIGGMGGMGGGTLKSNPYGTQGFNQFQPAYNPYGTQGFNQFQ